MPSPGGSCLYPLLSSHFLIDANCRFSCAFLIIGLATAPQRRSAMIVAARCVSNSETNLSSLESQTKISGSAILMIIFAILPSSISARIADILGGSCRLSSMLFTKVGDAPLSPIRRSTANGGQVDILSVGNILGCSLSTSGLILNKFSVRPSDSSTSLVTRTRVSLNATGAKFINHSLYISTDFAISSFHLSGLSRLTAIGAL